jgi:hypothetical protein
MSQVMNVKVNNPHGLALLKELEAIGVITIEKLGVKKNFNGKQYRGIVPNEDKEQFKKHIETVRNEWERDF